MVNLPFFIYLTKLLEHINQIDLAKILIKDIFLKKHFLVDDILI